MEFQSVELLVEGEGVVQEVQDGVVQSGDVEAV